MEQVMAANIVTNAYENLTGTALENDSDTTD